MIHLWITILILPSIRLRFLGFQNFITLLLFVGFTTTPLIALSNQVSISNPCLYIAFQKWLARLLLYKKSKTTFFHIIDQLAQGSLEILSLKESARIVSRDNSTNYKKKNWYFIILVISKKYFEDTLNTYSLM